MPGAPHLVHQSAHVEFDLSALPRVRAFELPQLAEAATVWAVLGTSQSGDFSLALATRAFFDGTLDHGRSLAVNERLNNCLGWVCAVPPSEK